LGADGHKGRTLQQIGNDGQSIPFPHLWCQACSGQFPFLLGDVVDDKQGFHSIKATFLLHQNIVFTDSELCSYGGETMFSRGRSNAFLRLKQGSQYCNPIEKDRSLGKERSFSTQRTIVCQAAKCTLHTSAEKQS
jgi:hypothetical protein